MDKICRKCTQSKPTEDFWRGERRCKKCKAEDLKLQREQNKELMEQQFLEKQANWPDEKFCKGCNEQHSVKRFAIAKRNKDGLENYCDTYRSEQRKELAKTEEFKEKIWKYNLQKQYNLTEEKYFQLLERQNGGCAICGQSCKNKARLSIDHDHNCCNGNFSCGKCIRGLLCHIHNAAIGLLNDSPLLVEMALKHLNGVIFDYSDILD